MSCSFTRGVASAEAFGATPVEPVFSDTARLFSAIRPGGLVHVVSRRRQWRRTFGLGACLAVVLAVGLLGAAASTAATSAAFSRWTPAPGTSAGVANPVISVNATDVANITNATMTVDGVYRRPSINYLVVGSTWVDDGCGGYQAPVYDNTQGTIAYSSYGLINGSHAVTTTVTNANGQVSVTAWTFGVAVPPTFSSPLPSNLTTVSTLLPQISVRVNANGAFTATMTVDGRVVPATAGGGMVTYSPQAPLASGVPHAIHVDATNSMGQTASTDWSFAVQSTPDITFSNVLPSADTTVGAQPVLSASVFDTVALSGAARLYVDGAQNTAYLTYPNPADLTKATLSYTWPQVLSDGPHTAVLYVSDASGRSSAYSVPFNVAAPPAIGTVAPADGSIVPTQGPTITADIIENSDVISPVVLFDGMPGLAYWDASAKRVTAVPASPLLDMTSHVVQLRVTDGVGLSDMKTWSFSVRAYPISIYGASPAPDSVVTVPAPVVSVNASDTNPVDYYATPVIAIDGTKLAVTGQDLTPGHWTGTGCDAQWVLDGPPFVYSLSAASKSLPDGFHTASVTLTGDRRRVTTYSWSFDVQVPPQVALSPAAGAVVPTQLPSLTATVTENGAIDHATMWLDGAQVAFVRPSAGTTRSVLAYTPSAKLSNDVTHTVRVEAVDTAGLVTNTQTSFLVQIYPDMSTTGSCTDCHATFPAAHPMTNCDACHLGGAPVEDCRACHGNSAHTYTEFDSTAWAGPYPCTRCHQQAYAYKVPMHPADTSFHTTSRDMSSCQPCHQRELTVEHNRYADANGAALTCVTCHENTSAAVGQAIANHDTRCESCHTTFDAHESKHTPDGLDWKCTVCHSASLSREHIDNLTTSGRGYGCQTCHGSADPSVTWAIFSGDRGCSACHTSAHGFALSPADPGLPKYSGSRWSQPLDASIYAGETWLPAWAASGGKVELSARRSDVSGDDVWAYYKAAMAAAGWTAVSTEPAPGASAYYVDFTRTDASGNTHDARVWYYLGEDHTGSPAVPSGGRIELIWK